jgi:hypothetical protein
LLKLRHCASPVGGLIISNKLMRVELVI